MAFVKKLWVPGRAGGTPFTAADQNRLEAGIDDLYNGAPWAAPTLANSWVSYGANDVPGYRIVANWLELRGAIKNGTLANNQLVMTVPGVTLTQRFIATVFDGHAGGSQVTIAGGLIADNSAGNIVFNQNFALASNAQILLYGIRIPLT